MKRPGDQDRLPIFCPVCNRQTHHPIAKLLEGTARCACGQTVKATPEFLAALRATPPA